MERANQAKQLILMGQVIPMLKKIVILDLNQIQESQQQLRLVRLSTIPLPNHRVVMKAVVVVATKKQILILTVRQQSQALSVGQIYRHKAPNQPNSLQIPHRQNLKLHSLQPLHSHQHASKQD